jgi:hypothetical protein
LKVITGYTRIVIGGHGPFIEFYPNHIIYENLHVPLDQDNKSPDHYYYNELRTNDNTNIKFYDQLHKVDYADYKVGMMYASPFELYVNGEVIIEDLRNKKKKEAEKDVQRIF